MLLEKDLAKVKRLRLRRDEDGSIIAVTIARKLRGNFLYYHGPDVLGVYYKAETARRTHFLRQWWLQHIDAPIVEEYPADFDGLILFSTRKSLAIPAPFFRKGSTVMVQTSMLETFGLDEL